MDRELLHLLETNSRVIVPDLGAFILRQQDPRKVVFNDLLTFNDGMLGDYLEKTEGLTPEDASDRIREFVRDVKDQLAGGDEVKLKGLGTLKMDDAGKILFAEPSLPHEEKAEEPVPGKKKASGKKKSKEKKKEKSDPFTLDEKSTGFELDATRDEPVVSGVDEPPFSIDQEPPVQPEKEEEEEEEEEERVADEPVTHFTREESPPAEAESATPEPEPVDEPATPVPDPPLAQHTSYSYTPPPQKKKFWPWILGAVIVLVILTGGAWLLFPEEISDLLSRQSGMETMIPGESLTEEPPAQIEVAPEEASAPEPIPEEPAAEQTPPGANLETVPAGKQYYVVAGCFENPGNAEAYVRQLSGMGYDSRIFGMRKDLHAVCFNAHPTKGEALAEMKRIRREYEPSAWVLYY